MRELCVTELKHVHGAAGNYHNLIDTILFYGSIGMVFTLTQDYSVESGWQGFLVGAGVGLGRGLLVRANEQLNIY